METISLRLEKAGRRGKTVTVLTGFTRHADEMEELSRKIKSALGTGGTVKGWTMEIQGDFRTQISRLLQTLGFLVK